MVGTRSMRSELDDMAVRDVLVCRPVCWRTDGGGTEGSDTLLWLPLPTRGSRPVPEAAPAPPAPLAPLPLAAAPDPASDAPPP